MYEQFFCFAISLSKKWFLKRNTASQMNFEKEHSFADEYCNYKSHNVGFTQLIGFGKTYYYVSFKKDGNVFNGDLKLFRFQKLFDEYDLKAKGWSPFKYVIKETPSWSDYDFEFIVYSKKEKY